MNRDATGRQRRNHLCFALLLVVAATTAVYARKPERVRHVTPDGGLQQALDDASPGDVITLAPGTHVGPVTVSRGGDTSEPVVIRAEEPGTVTLTNAAPPDFTAAGLPALPLQEVGLAEATPAFNGQYVDFALRADSPAVDAGAPDTGARYHHDESGPAPDLGAIELGDTWEFPRPGPRWAVGNRQPWRPPLPPSLHPCWVGLAD